MVKLAYLVSHPIQYQAPLLKLLAEELDIDLRVYFCSDLSLSGYHDEQFGTTVSWDVPLLEGYRSEVLPCVGSSRRISLLRPFSYGLRSRFKSEKFDALWVHGYYRPYYLYAMLLARSCGAAVLLRDETNEFSRPRSMFRMLAKGAVMKLLNRLVDSFLAIGRLNADYYLSHGVPPERIFSAPYTVDNEFFREAAERAASRRSELRRELGLREGVPVILYAGKFMARKRPGDLLEAYAALATDGKPPAADLLMVGDGELRSSVEAQANELGWPTIRFLGFKNQTELPALYDLCDIFVLPSFNEPWGLSVNEVMNAGCAVVVSDQVAAGYDLVIPQETGLVFPAGDVSALSRCLAELIAEPQRTARMAERGREHIAEWDYRATIAGIREALAAAGRGTS